MAIHLLQLAPMVIGRSNLAFISSLKSLIKSNVSLSLIQPFKSPKNSSIEYCSSTAFEIVLDKIDDH